MRIDLISIFPAYFDALDLSLPGKARSSGLLEVVVHDLRDWTHDRHRSVDDTPYGGGAGMVMKPGPWGEALDAMPVGPAGATLVVPTPAGRPFTQALARELAGRQHLVFACGRYEGIDQRVVEEAGERYDVWELSVGDYVLNGGEVAALAVCEAVVRLLPGFMGNPESLVEESHEDGLLEAPVYTKPAAWRGREVPPVLLGGDHGAIARWRHEQSVRRTAQRRPDLLSPSVLTEDVELRRVQPGRRGGAVHAPARVLAPGGAGQPGRRDPRAGRVARRRAGLVERGGRARGAVARPARRGGAGRAARRGLAHRPPDGGPGPPGRRARPFAPGRDRGRGARRGDVVHAVHGRQEPAQPADVQASGVPAGGQPGAGRGRHARPRSAELDFETPRTSRR